MTLKKKIGIGVGGLLALSAIGNATEHKPAHATTTVAPIVRPVISYQSPTQSKPKPVKPKPKPVAKKKKAHCNIYDINAKCAENQTPNQPDNNCSDEATAIAIASALGGNIGNAVAAGKIAGQTAGTGEKC